MAAQNDAIRINYINAKIDNTQENGKCSLCVDRDETVNHIITKLAIKGRRLVVKGDPLGIVQEIQI